LSATGTSFICTPSTGSPTVPAREAPRLVNIAAGAVSVAP